MDAIDFLKNKYEIKDGEFLVDAIGTRVPLDLVIRYMNEFKITNKSGDWREAAKDLSNAIVEHPNLYGIYTIYEEIEKIVRMVDPTILEPNVIKP